MTAPTPPSSAAPAATPLAPTHPWLALGAMLAVQMLATTALIAASVLAPVVAPQLGIAPERLGTFVALAYLTAMGAGLMSGHWAARIGAVRLSQCGLLACSLGLLVALAGTPLALLAAAVCIGAGYGVTNPAAASVLTRHTPASSYGLFFSVKQTGVPLGVAAAGVLLPLGLAWAGWRTTLALNALLCAAMLLALLTAMARLDPPGARSTAGSAAGNPLAAVWHDPALRRLSFASLFYALTQQLFLTFAVTWLVLHLHWSLQAAAGLLAASQVVAALARIVFGRLTDRWMPPGRLLAWLGWSMGFFCFGLAWLGPATPPALVVAAVLACSATAVGWNGVFFAGLARMAPPGRMAALSGGAQVFTFAGGMIGPLLFGELVRVGGSYPLAYALFALLPIAMGTVMWRAHRRTG
jgi:MFS family permease